MVRRPVFCLAVVTTIVSCAFADDFGNFRIPTNRAYSLIMSLSGEYTPYNSDANLNHIEQKYLYGSGSGNGWWFLDGERHYRYWGASASAYGRHERYESTEEPYLHPNNNFSYFRDQDNKTGHEHIQLQGTAREYPWSKPVGVEVSVGAEAIYTQAWDYYLNRSEDAVYRSEYLSDKETWTYDYRADGSVSIGLGRVRNATGVYKVYLLEQRLRELGILARSLSQAARRKLAELFYVQDQYSQIHDRSSRFFWRDIERILRDDGALHEGGLDAQSTYRIGESYAEPVSLSFLERSIYLSQLLRQTGHYVGLTVQAAHDHLISRETGLTRQDYYTADSLYYRDSTDVHFKTDTPLDYLDFGIRAEYHKPLGFRWQLDAEGSLLFPTDKPDKGLDWCASLNLYYLLADRWLALAFLSHERGYGDDQDLTKSYDYHWSDWNVRFGAAVSYYIEDRLSIRLSASQEQRVRSPSLSGWEVPRRFDRLSHISVGMSYHFLGGIDAPDLGIKERLLPLKFR